MSEYYYSTKVGHVYDYARKQAEKEIWTKPQFSHSVEIQDIDRVVVSDVSQGRASFWKIQFIGKVTIFRKNNPEIQIESIQHVMGWKLIKANIMSAYSVWSNTRYPLEYLFPFILATLVVLYVDYKILIE